MPKWLSDISDVRALIRTKVKAGVIVGVTAMLITPRVTDLLAQTSPSELPKPTDYVSDFAHVLSPRAVERLDHSKADAQVAVVTISNLNGAEIKDYVTKLGNTWGIGKKGSNRGVLILLAVNDRKWRIAVGYGLESVLPDSKVAGIGLKMIPLLRANNFDDAATLVVDEITKVILADAKVTPAQVSQPHSD